MEIFTLLKANIMHRKGSFISIILLMIIVSMSLSAIISAQDNVMGAAEKELDRLNSGNVVVYIQTQSLSDELLGSVQNSALTKEVISYPAFLADKMICGEENYLNPLFIQKQRDGYKLFNKEQNGYESVTPALNKGEIYLTLGMLSNMPCKIGDKVTMQTAFGNFDFTVKGFVVEPVNGSALIGWKQIFISGEDFDALSALCVNDKNGGNSADIRVLHIYKADDCELSDARFLRQLNLETGINNNSIGSVAKEQSAYYTNLLADTILNILMVFIVFLFVIVLIVMRHSITTGIEMEYVSLGVLKSLGFSDRKIRLVFAMQYLSAQLVGTIIGVIASVPLTAVIGNIFLSLNAMLAESGISFGKVSLVILFVFLISLVFIALSTIKIGKISPVKAITGGKSEIYFDSRLNMPIRKNRLSASLAMRQFTTAKRQYIGVIAVVSILVFFMMSMMITGNAVSSRSALESMGLEMNDCEFSLKNISDDEMYDDIEKSVCEISEITKKIYQRYTYFSVDGEQIMALMYRNPENIAGITDGRAPLYDNEIMITEIISDIFGVKIGDTMKITMIDKTAEYLIVGCCQSFNDTGKVLSMSFGAASRLGDFKPTNGGFNIADKDKAQEVVDMLNSKYGDILEANVLDEISYVGMYQTAVGAMKLVIYILSALFALVVVSMVCKKAFLKEKIDIGIFKAIGFTANRLRIQFAFRFLIVAVIGSVIGSVFSLLFTDDVLSMMLRVVGVTDYAVNYTFATFAFPIGIVCVCFFTFAYLAAKRVKRVEIRELVSE